MAASNPPSDNSIIIPDDVIFHFILPKLPPKSIVRLKCVSKHWKSIISNPTFKILPKHRSHALLITSTTYKLLRNEDLANSLRSKKPSGKLPTKNMFILGSCNGLVLFCILSDIFLWIPTTSYCRKVHELDYLDSDYSRVSGFCYDASTDDYIVLAAFRQMSPGWNFPVISSTLKSKRWRLVSFPYDVDSIEADGPIVNNLLHWLASPIGSYEKFVGGFPNSIIYFDAPSNGFKKLPSPDPKEEGGDDNLVGLGVIDYCLCLMRNDKGDVEVLIMKEYGVKESWTTMFCILHHNKYNYWRMNMLICSWNVDFILFSVIGDLYVYYPRTRHMEKIKVPDAFGWVRAIRYVDEALAIPTKYYCTKYYWNEKTDKKKASTRALRKYGIGLDDDFSEVGLEDKFS